MQPSAYFHSDKYHLHVDRLENIARTFDPAAPDMLRSQIIEALGDLGVWPMTAYTGSDEGEAILIS